MASNSHSRTDGGGFSFIWVLIAIGVGIALLSTIQRREPPASKYVGLALPPLNGEGWLNVAGPVREDSLRGQVVVVDCWFVDCPPCRASMPHLVEFYRKYRGRGVQVIGLTPDSGNDAARAQAFVEGIDGLDWPIATGAAMPLEMLGIQEFPTLLVFDRTGKSVWAGHSVSGLEAAVEAALAANGRETAAL
jgi:thiol-disulfide isomerase/thioredoxin